MSEKDLGPIPEFCPCDSCGHLIPTEQAYADMETLTVLCPRCLQEKLRPCEECGSLIRAAAYQHLSSGRVLCEPCAVGRLTGRATN
jgi:formylmethanofuran dehydrogenase subunit E